MSTDHDPIEAGTPVTAIQQFDGARADHDLNFEIGDVIKITKIVDKTWAMGKLKEKSGFIPLSYVKPINWFHGKITREQAEFLLQDKTEGSYLVRESTHFPGDYTLCLKSADAKIENYHIKRVNLAYTIDDERNFQTLIKLVQCYMKVHELASLLKTPVIKQKQVESDDLETLINHTKCHSSIIDISNIQFGKDIIGTGEFGAVYKGKYNNMDVAIKVIKDQTTIKEFFKEAAVMSTLNHQNLLKLFGVVFSNDRKEIYLVTEFMPKGSLYDYLITRGRSVLTKKELIQFAVHVCEGMSYLEEKGIVHRDLAASNVLISEDQMAKVSDFGLAKQIMDETVNSGRIRIKWSAPESIKEKLYSNKSDMWSYGILLWEIFSFGRVPYPRIPLNDVIQHVEQGNRMEKPEGCPDEIYSLMKLAWVSDPTMRPSFKEMLVKLKDIQSNNAVLNDA